MNKKITALLVIICLCFSCVGGFAAQNEKHEIKNIIYMIPDGGGMSPFYLADAVKTAGGLDNKEIDPFVTKTGKGHLRMLDYLVGAITTYCADSEVTDSAAAGTALSTGYKSNKGYIGLDKDKLPRASILEICQKLGMRTGMATTYDWSNATPASFSAHNESRSNNGILSEQTVNQDIDVILGVGFDMSGWSDISEAEKRGYKIINDREELSAVAEGDRIWGNLERREFPFDVNNTESTVTLKEMTEAAIKALSGDNGFFLMVEGSRIDNGGHSNNVKNMVGDFLAFDEAFGAAVDFAKGRDDTIVIACPDHDTGGMILPKDLTAAVDAIRNGVDRPEGITWTGTGHTAENGGLFIYIPDWLGYPKGIDPASKTPFESNVIDNTDIIPYITDILGADRDEYTKVLFVDVTDKVTYDSYSKIFKFNDYPATAKKNASYAFYKDSVIDLGGEVCVYANERFYVPQKLLDVLEGKAEPVPYNTESPVNVQIEIDMSSGSGANIEINLKNYLPESVGGYIKFKSPEALAAKGNIDFGTLAGFETKTLTVGYPEVDKNGFECDYDIVFENGKTYSLSQKIGGVLYAAYTETPITVDGVADEEQWKNAPKIVCDDVSMLVDIENWKGFRDLSSVFSILYDEENLYFCSIVTDEIFCQDEDPGEIWKGDSVQFGFYDDTEGLYAAKAAGGKYAGLNFGYKSGEPIAYRSRSQVDGIFETGVIKDGGLEFQCSHDGDDLTYEIKVPWKELFGYDLDLEKVKMLAFSYLVNDNDGEGRRGAMEFGSGIYSGKDVNKFLRLYLIKGDGFAREEEKGIDIYYRDELLGFKSSKPFIRNNRTFVSANEFLDNIGIEYTADTQAKNITVGNIVIGKGGMTVDGEAKTLDVEPFFANSMVFAPIRALCEAMGMTVEWQQEPASVYIK